MSLLHLLACNAAPGAPTVGIAPLDPTTSDDLQAVIQGDAADPDGDAVTYAYAWFVDGVARTDLSGATVPASETTKHESWKVVVTPSDGTLEGTVGEASVSIANTTPSAIVTLDPLSPTAADTVTASAATSDDDGDAVDVAWTWTRNGAGVGLVDPVLPAGTAARGEAWTVTATPDDGEDRGEPAAVAFTIGNARPTLGAVALAPDVATVDDTITASFSGVDDADGDAVTLVVTWWVDDVEVATDEIDAADTSSLSGAFAKGQTVVVTAVPSDGYDEGVEATSDPLVVANSAPTGTGARIDPDPVRVDSEVRCLGEGWTDADGDAEGWQVSWTVDDVVVSTDDVLPPGSYARADEIGCTLAPYDGEAAGEPLVAPPVVVQNSAPTCALAAVTIGADPVTVADTAIVTVDGFSGCADADGDPIDWIYAWTVDGVWVAGSTTLPVGEYAERGDTVLLDLTATDGIDAGASATSNPLVVANAVPVVSSLQILPATAYTDTTVTGAAAGDDADGDTVTFSYAWTVNGAAAGSGTTLEGSAFAKGQTVTLSVTPRDGTDAGTASTASVVVANSAPGAPTVGISPPAPGDDDALVCLVHAAAPDADGDGLTYTFSWSVGGVPYASPTTTTFPGDTIPASATSQDQEWTCAVTASDGTASGEAGAATVSVGCDLDEDGYTDDACGGDDCDDTDAAIHPGATEVCDAADVDEDCDGLADDDDDSLSGTIYYPDLDHDTYGDADGGVAACTRPSGYLTNGDDCDDTSSAIRPGGTEVCDTGGADEDCDGLVNDADGSMTRPDAGYSDADGDGYYDPATAKTSYLCVLPPGYSRPASYGDCDDGDAAISPGAEEVCGDGIDNDCDDASYPCGIEGDGSSTEAAALVYFTSVHPSVGIGDLNGDGEGDIVTSDTSTNETYVFLGPIEMDTVYRLSDADVTIGASLLDRVIGDLDADGDDDLLVAAPKSSSATWYVVDGDPTMASSTPTTSFFAGSGWDTYGADAAGDFDDDGLADVYVYENETTTSAPADQLTVYLEDGATTVTYTSPGTGYFTDVADEPAGDLDGDGIDDIAATFYRNSSNTWVYVLSGDPAPAGGALGSSDSWFAVPNIQDLCAAGDLTGDGYDDVGITTDSAFYLFAGPPTTGLTYLDAYLSDTAAGDCVAGDTDGDGVTDLFVTRSSGFYFYPDVYRYEAPLASGSFSGEEARINMYEPLGLQIGELSGDGYDELIVLGTAHGSYVYTGGEP